MEERQRAPDRERDGDGTQRRGGGGGGAWSKGMPRSLGGPIKPVILLRKKVEEEVPVSQGDVWTSTLCHSDLFSVHYNVFLCWRRVR